MKRTENLIKTSLKAGMLVAIVAVLFTACKKSEGNELTLVTSKLKVVNASAGPLTINYLLGGVPFADPALAYTQQSAYFATIVGSFKIDITTGGTTTSLANSILTLEKDKYYTVFVAGTNSALSTVLTEDNQTAPATGKAKIRFLNLCPDGPAFNLSTSTGTVLFSNLTFEAYSDFTTIDPANYTFQLKNATGGSALVSLDKVLEAGKSYTMYVAGLVAGSGTTALKIQSYVN